VSSAADVLAAILAVLVNVHEIRVWSHTPDLSDFRAFYAAGEVVARDRADPYLYEPLFEREQQNSRARLEIAVPSPLPPFDFLPLWVLGNRPFRVAAAAMALAILVAGAVTSVAVARSSRIPVALAVAAVFLVVELFSLHLGQVAPVAIAGIAVATWALRVDRPRVAALGLLIALVEPHAAATAIVATFLVAPRTRVPLAIGVAVLVAASVAAFGPDLWRMYATTLPIHAAAEVRQPYQYSTTWLAHALGASASLAPRIGALWYALTALAAITAVALHRERAVRTGAAVLLPATCAVLGGTFVHVPQIVVALVPALVYLRPSRRWIDGSFALALLVIPFPSLVNVDHGWPRKPDLADILLCAAVAWATVFAVNRSHGGRFAAGKASLVTGLASALFAAFAIVHGRLDFPAVPAIHATAAPGVNASVVWIADASSDWRSFPAIPFLIAVKACTWLGMAIAAVMCLRALRPSAIGLEPLD